MAIRIRKNGDLMCAANTKEKKGDTYLNDDIHYYLSQLTGAIRPSKTHEKDNLWFWNIQNNMIGHYAEINLSKETKNTKNTIKLIQSITNLFKTAIDYEKAKTERLLVTPIPDYSKGKKSDGLMIVGQPNQKETIVMPDGKKIDIPDYNKLWGDKLNEHLKEKGLNSSQPFGFPDIKEEDKCPKCKSSDISICCERGLNGENINTYDECENCKHKFKEDIKNNYDKFVSHKPIVDHYFIDYKGNRTEINKPFDFELIIPKPIDYLKTCFVNGIEHNLEYKGNGMYLIKDSIDNFRKGMIKADKELQKACQKTPFDWIEFTNDAFKPKHVHDFSITETVYELGTNKILNIIKHCKCGEKSWYENEELIKKRKNRQLEIGKEIEKLRNEARTIKNQLKDSK